MSYLELKEIGSRLSGYTPKALERQFERKIK